ncbi:efflux RND transporter periplasmic adaptor subunit [Ramlibacter solisilvae]|uniref:RND transporter MFP subunit n=1 Tax=Ramlibacter tataouinensis TaxID=94132 RepID=A0A127JX57_9BURK|nr:efflux RND transporter periplasmic adaptor subunit [Ramlibacter tataouinensis]AMO24588.1 RND transporter MFP subunit [Ramlibacter tataouinensis]
MKRTHVAAAVLVAVGLAAGGFMAGQHFGAPTERVARATEQQGERKVLYWHDPMVPGPRFDKPGKSPFMDMPLVPVYADEQNETGVKVSPGVQQNLGIRTATVTRAQVASSFDAIGTVQFDERLTQAVQTRVNGYVERLRVRAPMEYVRKGQPLATIYAPDWLGPQNEYLALKRAGVSEDILAAARERMRAMSIPDELLRQSEQSGVAQARFTVTAPLSGVVAELGVRDGVAVNPGMTLFRIAGLERVWAVAEVPEAQAVRLVRGQKVKAALQADASQTFDGELKEILPQVSSNTRTVQARFEVANKGGRLTPGMLLRLQVAGPVSSRLVVPAEAVIRTGSRAVAIVRKESGTFEPREVALGADLGDQLEIAQGLNEGEQVVASGQFLVDSEARLKSVLGGMAAAGQAAPAASAPASQMKAPAARGTFTAQGKVESVEPDSITISHEPVPELKWPSMTMGFSKPNPQAFPGVKPGDSIRFEFKKGGPMGWELVTVQPAGAGK